MKKLMNALLLILAIATIFSTLIIVSMADTEGGTATVADTSRVGSYTAPAGSWTPDANHAGITYGVWYGSNAAEAENKFLAGTKPDYWSSSTNITATNICGDTSMHRYVHLFANNLTHDELKIYNWSSVTINLAGNTLNTATNILVGGDNINGNRDGVKLTIKNGKSYSKYPATIKTAMNTVAYYENVYFDIAKNNYEALFWDYGAKETTFKGCVIKFLGNAGMYMLGTSNKAQSSLSFINTHIEQPEAAATTPFINVSPMTDKTTVYSIRFDKDSSMNRSSDYIVNVWRNDTTSATKVNVYFEEGFECTNKSIPSMTYQVAGRGTAGTVYECTSSSIVRMAVVAPGSSTAISSWKAFYQADGTLTLGRFENYTAAEHNANDERIVYKAWSEKEIGTAGSYLDGIVSGWTVVKLYDDVTINTKGTNKYLTIDLNGHTLKLTERFEVGSQGSAWRAEYVKFISSSEIPGTLDLSSISAEKFYARPGKSLYFDNLEVNFKGTLVNDSAGLRLASFKDCNLVGTGNVVVNYNVNSALSDLVSWINAGNTRQYIFDNTSIPSAVPVYISGARTADRVNVTVKNGCVIGTSAAVNIHNSASGVEVSVDMSIDTKLQNFGYYAVNVDNNSAVVPVVNYKNGNETVDFSRYAMAQDGDFYVYVPKPAIDPETVMVNLTLYTDFDINFFTTAAVKGVYHKGAPIEAENYEGGKKYVVEGISPDTAADDIDLIFVIEVDGKDYYLRLTYSVLKYSSAVVKDSDISLLGKQLVSAAMEYIKSAYAYTGKTVPEFEGVEVKPSVNNAEAVTYLTDAIKGVQMKLDEGFRLRFNIKPEYSGKLTVGSTTYEVLNGQVGELTYVEVEVRAYKLVDSITVSDGTNTASYGLANYAKSSVVSSDAKLKAMVDALYTFCTYASEYKTSNPNLD